MPRMCVLSGRIRGGVWEVKAVDVLPNGQQPVHYRWARVEVSRGPQ